MTFSFDILNPYGGQYPNVPIQDNPLLDDYNVNERLGDFMNYLNNMVAFLCFKIKVMRF